MLILPCVYAIISHIYINTTARCGCVSLSSQCSFNRTINRNICNFISNGYKNTPINGSKWLISNRPSDSSPDYSTFERILQSSSIRPLKLPQNYYILCIETSCDDTAVAVLDNKGNVISEFNKDQSDILEKYKGIHPLEAKLQHEKFIKLGIDYVLDDSKIPINQIGFIAVTRGPGLELCLRVGYNAAIEFGKLHNIPVVGSNHIASHIITPIYDLIDESNNLHETNNSDETNNLINDPTNLEKLRYPFLALLVSGGHSQIYVASNPTTFYLLCDSVDTYMGASLDKAARMLGLYLGNSGGPSLELAAREGINTYSFKEPLSHTQACQFSFSGINSQLERYILYEFGKNSVDSLDKLPKSVINNLAKAVQDITISHVITQLDKAMDIAEVLFGINQLALVGGVACNGDLKSKISLHLKTRNKYEYRRQLTNKFVNRQLKVIRKFKSKKIQRDFLNISTSDLITQLWSGEIIYDKSSEKTKKNTPTVFDNEKWNKVLNSFLYSIDPIEVQKIVNGLIHLHNKSIYNLLDIAKISSNSVLNGILNMQNTLRDSYTRDNTNLDVSGNSVDNTNSLDNTNCWKLFVSSKKRCRDNAAMIGWSVLEKLRQGLNAYSVTEINESKSDLSNVDVYDKWDLSKRRHLDVLTDICKLDAAKLLYNYKMR